MIIGTCKMIINQSIKLIYSLYLIKSKVIPRRINGSLNQSAKCSLTQTINNATKWKERLTNTRQLIPESPGARPRAGDHRMLVECSPMLKCHPTVSRHPTQGDDDSQTAVQPQGQRTLLVCAGQQNRPRGKSRVKGNARPHHHTQISDGFK